IVAFWKPGQDASAGTHHSFSYTLSFAGRDVAGQETGQVVKTFVGDGNRTGGGDAENAYRIIVDFAGGPLDQLKPDAPVISNVSEGSGSEGAEILEHYVEYVDADDNWRLSMLVRPGSGQHPLFRGQLLLEDKPLTEVWTYPLS